MKGKPQIERVTPAAAIAGGEVLLQGRGFADHGQRPPQVKFGETPAAVVVASEDFLIAQVPEGADGDSVRVQSGAGETPPMPIALGVPLADNLHPVSNPAVDPAGNIYVTFSGRRGQKVPMSLYRIGPDRVVKPFLSDLMNPTGLAFDSNGMLYVSSRFEGVVYRVAPDARKERYAEGMGVATGIAFDADEYLYVGDRTGTLFKIGRDRQIFVFATLEPSVAAYHLAFGPDRQLYVTGPTTSSYDAVYRVNQAGRVSAFYRGLGRPQGLAFDVEGNLYVAASLQGRRGVVRITPAGQAELVISGPNLVGLAFLAGGLALATTNAVYHLRWPVAGLPLLR